MSQPVRAKRGPMINSAICGTVPESRVSLRLPALRLFFHDPFALCYLIVACTVIADVPEAAGP